MFKKAYVQLTSILIVLKQLEISQLLCLMIKTSLFYNKVFLSALHHKKVLKKKLSMQFLND